MNESNIKNELLKQDGGYQAQAEVAQMRKMVETEDRRARRLTRWAIAAWALFFLLLGAGLILPMIMYQLSQSSGPAAHPATAPAAISQHHSPGIIVAILGPILVAGFFALPLVGIALTIMAFSARRTAGRKQIVASLASIESQLRLLTSSKGQSPEG